ncbi:ricin-type beta-trefoil lectin domain protein [Streptomyces poriticola]|uniref:ricin-type beta-trefoil lectin domain protein n=1 Tax=Streptomyces poriticola TaxID=3120506 RepID=UPI002FCDE31B
MQSAHPPRPPYPPCPGAASQDSDRDLLAAVGDSREGPRAVALLLARHWRAAYEYAVICCASAADPAALAATAALREVLAGPVAGALRPQVLVTVRQTVAGWADDDRISALLPELRKPTGGRGLRAARTGTPERRHIAEHAFRALPAASQCLLWHAEAEGQPISVPAGLLGVDAATASAALQRAREQFRDGCVSAHRELAPTRECGYYNRLLDGPVRRGGVLLPDVRRHLTECRYCRDAVQQIGRAEAATGLLLAETVLGWGARRYYDSRPGRTAAAHPARQAAGRADGGGRHRLRVRTGASGTAGLPAVPGRRGRAVAVGVGLASLALLATALVTRGWSEGGETGPGATWGAPSSAGPGPGTRPGADHAQEVARGRLRNLAVGLCLDARDGGADGGAGVTLAECSAAASQQWSYREDGLLRGVADPTRCLGSDADTGSVLLAGCVVHPGEVRYDLTVRGELLLRGGTGSVVAGGPDGAVAVATRDGSAGQRWLLDTGPSDQPRTRDTREPRVHEDVPLSKDGAPQKNPSGKDDAPPRTDGPARTDRPQDKGRPEGERQPEVRPPDPEPPGATDPSPSETRRGGAERGRDGRGRDDQGRQERGRQEQEERGRQEQEGRERQGHGGWADLPRRYRHSDPRPRGGGSVDHGQPHRGSSEHAAST